MNADFPTQAQRRHGRRAFTLIELLVVISLMVFLMGLLVSAVKRMETNQRRGETTSRMHALARALSIYRADWGDVPPYNPTGEAGVPHGAGLWTLFMLDYLTTPRMLHDAGYPRPLAPWVLVGGSRSGAVDPGSNEGLLDIYNFATGSGQVSPLTPNQRFEAFMALADPAAHALPLMAGGQFKNYDDEALENWCSWMMQDPFTGEFKYQPVRRTGGAWPVHDPSQSDFYHRQLSAVGTDDPSSRYLPAADTVVTWSTAFRTRERQPDASGQPWGVDIVLYADSHVGWVPAPHDSGGWGPPRAALRVPVQ